jgi:hypothetical protein
MGGIPTDVDGRVLMDEKVVTIRQKDAKARMGMVPTDQARAGPLRNSGR